MRRRADRHRTRSRQSYRLITTSTYTVDEDFSEADRVVPELGDEPDVNITLADLGELAAEFAA